MTTPGVRTALDRSRDWPLTGRSVELAFGQRVLDQPSAVLVITGQAGVGKSRLARELAETVAAHHDLAIVRVVGSPTLTSVPLGALIPLLRGPGLAIDPSPVPGDQQLEVVAPNLHHALLAHARQHSGVLVVVDDAHVLDDVSASALRDVATRGDIRLVATVRADGQITDRRVAAWRTEHTTRLELLPLSEAEVGRLLEAVLGSVVATESIHQLAECSGANCLALREVVLDGVAGGRFTSEHGVVRWSPEGAVGPRSADLVASWVGRLDDDESTLLLAAALAGPIHETVLRDVAAALAGPPARATPAAVSDDHRPGDGTPPAFAALRQRGAIVVDEDGLARLGHPLYGEVIRANASPVQLVRSRSSLIRYTLQRLRPTFSRTATRGDGGDERDDGALAVELLRLGAWVLDHDHDGPVVDPDEHDHGATTLSLDDRRDVLVATAEQAARFGAVELALAAATGAVDAGAVDALAVAADALLRLGRADEAELALSNLWAQASDLPAAVVRRAAQAEQFLHLVHRHDRAAAARALDAALARISAPDDVAYLRAAEATFATLAGDWDAVEATAGLDSDDPLVRLRGLPARVATLVAAGQIREAVSAADAGVAEAVGIAAEAPEGLRWSVSALANALLADGDLIRLAELSELGRRFDTVESEASAFRGLMDGRAALFAGRADQALANLGDATEWYERRGEQMRLRWLLALLAEAQLLSGQTADAVDTARLAGKAERSGNLADFDADRALGWVAAWSGPGRRSASGLLRTAEEARDRHARPFELLVLWDAFRLVPSTTVRRRLVALAPTVSSRLAGLLDRAVRAETGAQLDGAARDFADQRFWLWATETGLRASAAFHAEGRRPAAARAEAAAHDWWDECGRPPSPTLAGRFATSGRAMWAPLTPREREVAELAAAGATSRAIAEQLGISRRTVDNLLGRVYSKLGVPGRDGLRDVFCGSAEP